MSSADVNSDDLTEEDSLQLEELVRRFEEAWKQGRRPALEDYLPAAGPIHKAVLVELLFTDLEYRLKTGEPADAETYLKQFPALGQDPDAAGALRARERELRGRYAPAPPSTSEGGTQSRIQLRCPHCRNPFDLDAGAIQGEVCCPACGAVFRLEPAGSSATRPRLGRYELLEVIGRGAFGVVYRARDTELERLVAVKLPRLGGLLSEAEVDRFLREARSAAQLAHPGIVAIHDAGQTGETCFVVEELVQGSTLADLLRQRRPSFAEAARLVAAVADALHYAHERGVVHRDVKPSNIMLGADGAPHLMDFGLARRAAGEITVTVEGQVLGTPAYMSPEQARGQAHHVDGRGDVYSLGVILYELLTGELPFRGTANMVLHQVLSEEPRPPRRLNDKVPRDLETVCLKAMAKEPGRRYQTAAALADDLRRQLKGEPVLARPVGRTELLGRWCRRNPRVAGLSAAILVLLVAGLVGLGVAALHIDAARVEADQARQKAEAEAEANLRGQVQLTVAQGVRLLDDGDLSGSLLWFAEALRLEPGGPDGEDMHRVRFAAVLRQCPRPVQVWFHERRVNAVAFSPDGRLVLTASHDQTARVWRADTGAPVTPPLPHDSPVWDAAFSPDGRLVLTISEDDAARLWDASSGQLRASLRHKGRVNRASFGAGGSRVITASRDGTAQVWETATGRAVGKALAHPKAVRCAGLSPDGRRALTLDFDQLVRLWDLDTGAVVFPPFVGGQYAAFSPDARRILTTAAKFGGSIHQNPSEARVWDAATGKPLTPPLRHADSIWEAAFSPDGALVLTASSDTTAQLWDVGTGLPHGPPLKHAHPVRSAAFSPDGRRVVTCSYVQTVRIWDVATSQLVSPVLRHPGTIWRAVFSSDGRQLLTACTDGTARLWDLATAEPALAPLDHADWVLHAAFSPDGRRVATAIGDGGTQVWDTTTGGPTLPRLNLLRSSWWSAFSPDSRILLTCSGPPVGKVGEARIWDALSGAPVTPPLPHTGHVRRAAFSPDGRLVVTASGAEDTKEGEARVWDVATGSQVGPPLKHGAAVRDACFSPDGRLIATASWDHTARLWGVGDGVLLRELRHPSWVERAIFSPDGRMLLTACWDHTLDEREGRLWDVATGEPVGAPLHHGDGVLDVAFSPRGDLVATASEDATARVWDALTGAPRTPPLRHSAWVRAVSFSADGRRVATASQDGTARVWDAATGHPVTPPLRHQGPIWHVAFSPDGRQLVTASQDWTARLWQLDPDGRPADDLVLLARFLASLEVDATGGLTPLDFETSRAAWQGLWARYPGTFASTPVQVWAWHRREAGDCERTQHWAAALVHLDRLVEAQPARGAIWLRRGRARAELGRWEASAADYARAIDLGTADSGTCSIVALLQLANGRLGDYRRACADMLRRFKDADSLQVLNDLVWTYALGPQVVADLGEILRLGRKMMAADPANADCQNSFGLLLYRAGNFEESVRFLTEALQKHTGSTRMWDLMMLAMAHQRMGHTAEARRCLAEATPLIDQALLAPPGAATSPAWSERLQLQLLRQEAEAQLHVPARH